YRCDRSQNRRDRMTGRDGAGDHEPPDLLACGSAATPAMQTNLLVMCSSFSTVTAYRHRSARRVCNLVSPAPPLDVLTFMKTCGGASLIPRSSAFWSLSACAT